MVKGTGEAPHLHSELSLEGVARGPRSGPPGHGVVSAVPAAELLRCHSTAELRTQLLVESACKAAPD